MRKDFELHLKTYLDDKIINDIKCVEDDNNYIAILFDEEKIDIDEFIKDYPLLKKHPFVNNAYIIEKNIYPFGKSLDFEIGNFYILEPCSLMVNYFLDVKEDDIVLDCCASPGGKTIHTSFNMKNKGLIIANEINYQRSLVLSSNIEKYGRKNVTVTNMDILDFPSTYLNFFDKIILDAPCSGSGMFRKENKMEEDWSIEKVNKLSSIQKEIILKAYSLLKPGGKMIYSTCSFSYEEDEEVILHLLNNSDAILNKIEDSPYFYKSSLKETIHLFPSLFPSEGHFIASISKPLSTYSNSIKIRKTENIKLPFNYEGYLKRNNDDIYLTNHNFDLKGLKIIRDGLLLGSIDKKLGFIPTHALSRCFDYLKDSIALNKEEAISYIKGNPINKMSKNGYQVLSYKNCPFALTKVSNNTLKNHYPKGLRKNIEK